MKVCVWQSEDEEECFGRGGGDRRSSQIRRQQTHQCDKGNPHTHASHSEQGGGKTTIRFLTLHDRQFQMYKKKF
jgi:hypothetical protein